MTIDKYHTWFRNPIRDRQFGIPFFYHRYDLSDGPFGYEWGIKIIFIQIWRKAKLDVEKEKLPKGQWAKEPFLRLDVEGNVVERDGIAIGQEVKAKS